MNYWEILSILTHLPLVPSLSLLIRRLRRYHTVFFVICATAINSLTLHTCRLFDEEVCLWASHVHDLMDHITAEGGFVVVLVLSLMIRNHHLESLLILFSIYTLGMIKTVYDRPWILIGVCVLVTPWIVYKWRSVRIPRVKTAIFVVLSVVGLVMYFLDRWYNYTHPLWHLNSLTSLWVFLLIHIDIEAEILNADASAAEMERIAADAPSRLPVHQGDLRQERKPSQPSPRISPFGRRRSPTPGK